jgi:two-component system cell cycle response regulator DivK
MSEGSSDVSRLVLLVEDHGDTREMMAWWLELNGLAVAHARTGEEALEMLAACAPDAITIDIGLPGMSGLELTRLLRQHPVTRAVPIVAITGWASARDVARAQEAGCDAVLTKPCPPDILLAEIQRLLSRAAEPSPAESGG